LLFLESRHIRGISKVLTTGVTRHQFHQNWRPNQKWGCWVQCFILRILGSGLSDDWGAETSPSSGYNHMHRHLLSGSMEKEKKKVHMAIFPLEG
jgi:hypothetical protein